MAVRWLLLWATLTVLLVACGGGGERPTPTSTASGTVTATVAPGTTGAVPPRPAFMDDYPAAIAAYLDDAGGAALGLPCLADLLAAWQMPDGRSMSPGTSTGQGRCVLGNTDGDPEDEIVVSLSASENETSPITTEIAVLDRTSAGYEVAYISPPLSDKTAGFPDGILATGDLTGDGTGNLAFDEIACGAHTCTWSVHVVSGSSSGYRELTPSDGLRLATADIRVEDTDGDGAKEIIMHGGIIESVGAGLQRAQTDVYAWDGEQYTLKSSDKDSSDIRLFKVQDADTAFAAGNYQEAAHLYQQAVGDTSLQEVGGFGSRDELRAYALFRLGLSELKLGDASAASNAIEQAISQYPVSLDGKAAVEFRNAANLTRVGVGDLSAGCQAAITFANQNLDRFREAWNYGYANPGFDPAKFCPL